MFTKVPAWLLPLVSILSIALGLVVGSRNTAPPVALDKPGLIVTVEISDESTGLFTYSGPDSWRRRVYHFSTPKAAMQCWRAAVDSADAKKSE